MSLVEHQSGDVAVLDVDEARALVGRIRQYVETALVAIKQAYEGRAWIALGYDGWAEMCAAEFGDISLPRDQRQALTADLRADGMSTRAIAAVTGASEMTVRRDLAGATNDAPANVVGLDGKQYTPPKREPLTPEEQACIDHRNAIWRAASRLEMFTASAHEFRDLRTNPHREEILDALVDSDRELIARYEEEITWKI